MEIGEPTAGTVRASGVDGLLGGELDTLRVTGLGGVGPRTGRTRRGTTPGGLTRTADRTTAVRGTTRITTQVGITQVDTTAAEPTSARRPRA